jgi:hypothetical protein
MGLSSWRVTEVGLEQRGWGWRPQLRPGRSGPWSWPLTTYGPLHQISLVRALWPLCSSGAPYYEKPTHLDGGSAL